MIIKVGKKNIECLCLTCETTLKGGFTPKDLPPSSPPSRSRSVKSESLEGSTSHSHNSRIGRSDSTLRPSALRNTVTVKLEPESDVEGQVQALPISVDGQQIRVESAETTQLPMQVLTTPSKSISSSRSRDFPHRRTDSLAPSATTSRQSNSHSPTPEPDSPVLREKSTRLAAKAVKPWAYLKYGRKRFKSLQEEQNKAVDVYVPVPEEDDDLPNDFPRCVTCARALMDRVWYGNRYFDHCQR
jgi:hypothetical protein